jgi:hypothetical protein
VAAVIQAQQALLSEVATESFAGRLASAGLVAGNALLFCGEVEPSRRISQATQQSLLEGNAPLALVMPNDKILSTQA